MICDIIFYLVVKFVFAENCFFFVNPCLFLKSSRVGRQKIGFRLAFRVPPPLSVNCNCCCLTCQTSFEFEEITFPFFLPI